MSGLEALDAIGDLGLLLSLAVALTVWLLSSRPRAAIALMIAMIVCAAATTLLKIYLHACPMTPLLRGPSGHVGFATLTYSALVAVIASRAPAWARLPLIAAGGALIAAVAVARYFAEAHSVVEIVFGVMIGLVSFAIFAFAHRRLGGDGGRSVTPLALAAVAIAVVAYGHHLNGEGFVNFVAFGGETAQLSVAAACPAAYGQRPAPAMEHGG
jgi:membrane-associated phospholipid phosphatase